MVATIKIFTRGSSQKTLAEVGHSGRSISIREHILLTHADTVKHFTLAMRSTKPSFLKGHHRHLRSRRSVQALAAQSAAPISTALPTRSPKTPSTVARLRLPQLQNCELPSTRAHDKSPDDISIASLPRGLVACGRTGGTALARAHEASFIITRWMHGWVDRP